MPMVAVFRRLIFAVIVTGGVFEVGVERINRNIVPFICRTTIVNIGQARTTEELFISNSYYAIRYRDTRKTCTTIEYSTVDARHTVANRHARKSRATLERRITDARHAVANRHARKTCAM